ncbi:hypothetical protein [Allosalinactinospora lopnorensis]|uniref:hypothetical protein n=1 Tax=Allosalinactinospora lopnorensis TaxID=1352348 RepID=UPI000623FFF2|nr:hypothetical protein [Allosalinactinospora lopnorensis]
MEDRPEFKTDEDIADALFDAVSESLRDHKDTRATKADLRASLVRADESFQTLHEWIAAGNPLPEPWRKHYTPLE